MSEEKKYNFNEEGDYNECILDPNNDRRIIICDSQNKCDGIVQCIGTTESQYIPDTKLKKTEKTHGTGTVIHIDNKNNIYILTAAHNILAAEKQCKSCGSKTLKTYCSNTDCNSKKKTKRTGHLIKPTHIYFSRRTHDSTNKLGQTIQRYQVEKYRLPEQYCTFPTARSGYDICIIICKCIDKHAIDLYKKHCSTISLINDETFGNNKCTLYIYGFPGEKRQEVNHRIYYYLFGMGTSKLDSTNNFKIDRNKDTNKLYIVNKGIDTSSGQSGSCIYSYNGSDKTRYLVYGIHSGGSEKHSVNWGTFFDIYNIEWIAKVLAEKDIYLANVISDKFIINHYASILALKWIEKNDNLEKEKELKKLLQENNDKEEEIKILKEKNKVLEVQWKKERQIRREKKEKEQAEQITKQQELIQLRHEIVELRKTVSSEKALVVIEKCEKLPYCIKPTEISSDTITIRLSLHKPLSTKKIFYVYQCGQEHLDFLAFIYVEKNQQAVLEDLDIEEIEQKTFQIALYEKEHDTKPISNKLQITKPDKDEVDDNYKPYPIASSSVRAIEIEDEKDENVYVYFGMPDKLRGEEIAFQILYIDPYKGKAVYTSNPFRVEKSCIPCSFRIITSSTIDDIEYLSNPSDTITVVYGHK